MGLMSRESVMAALEAVNEILKKKDQHETVVVTGGAALMFLFPDFYRPIKDIDACGIGPNLEQAIEEITWEYNLTEGWFNNEANEYYYPKEFENGPQFSNLKLRCPSKMYLLCMKILSNRPGERSNDPKDVAFLLDHMPEVRADKDWQTKYRQWFGKSDWNGVCAYTAHEVLRLRDQKIASEGSSTGCVPEPLMIALINQSEWKKHPKGDDGKVHIFTEDTPQPETSNPFRGQRGIRH